MRKRNSTRGWPHEGTAVPAADESAAAAAVPIAQVPPGMTVGEVLAALREGSLEAGHRLAVAEPGGPLLGLCRLADLVTGSPADRVGERMDPHPPVVVAGTHQEVAAARALEAQDASVAVVDAAGTLVGMIPPERVVHILVREHEEDLARLGGFHAGSIPRRRRIPQSALSRLVSRLPWLLVGVAGSFLAAGLMGSYELELSANLTLAFFLPGVVYLADAVGTQAEALVIRGLSVGEGMGATLRAELAAGPLLGLAVGAVSYPLVALGWDSPGVAAVVSLSLVLSCTVANSIAIALPYGMARLGWDPAFGAGPLATVIQDLLTISIYLWVAGRLGH